MKAMRNLLHFNRHVRRPVMRALMLMAMIGLMLMGVTSTVLSADLEVVHKQSGLQSFPVKDNDIIYKGALVCVDADGYLAPGADAVSYKFVGVAYEKVDNTLTGHSAGGKSCRVYTEGVFKLVCTSAITQAMVGQMMYLTDDQTVAATTGGTYYIPVGRLVEYVSATSGWVDIGQRHLVGGADNVILAPNATKMLEVHTWGIVMASGSFYLAADFGAYITSLAAGQLDLAATRINLRCGAVIWTISAGGSASAYPVTLTAPLIMSGVGAKVALAQVPSPSTRPEEGRIWYNSTDKKLEFSVDDHVELVTSVESHDG